MGLVRSCAHLFLSLFDELGDAWSLLLLKLFELAWALAAAAPVAVPADDCCCPPAAAAAAAAEADAVCAADDEC